MITGGDKFTHMTTFSNEKTFLITITGAEERGEMSIGGGIEKRENFMTINILLQKVILVGGMEYLITRIFPLITWIYLHLG